MRITSTRNPVVQYARSLGRTRVRREEGVYLVEGVRLVREAIATSQSATLVLYDPDVLKRSASGSVLVNNLHDWAERAYEVDDHVLRAAAQTEQPSGVLAVLRRVSHRPLSTLRGAPFGVVLDGLADPGNAGTILRTSAAAGVDYVAATPGTVDLFGPKVLRAGMGAHCRVPVYPGVSWGELTQALHGSSRVALDADGTNAIYGFRWPQCTMLVVGGEAHGVSREAQFEVEHRVRIPMKEGVESLNAAVADSIAIYAALGPALMSNLPRYR